MPPDVPSQEILRRSAHGAATVSRQLPAVRYAGGNLRYRRRELYAADTGAEAELLFTSLQQRVLTMIRNQPGELPPPVDSMNGVWTPAEEAEVRHRTYYAAVGSPETVRGALEQIIQGTGADELMITGDCFDQAARLHSYEIAARVMKNISGEPSR